MTRQVYALYRLDGGMYKLCASFLELREAQDQAMNDTKLKIVQHDHDAWPCESLESLAPEDIIPLDYVAPERDETTETENGHDLETITTELITLRKQGDMLSMKKAELLAQVKDGKLYKAKYKTFGAYCESIGYHRATVYDLIAAYRHDAIRHAYADIGAMVSKALTTAAKVLPDERIAELIDHAKQQDNATATADYIRDIVEQAQAENDETPEDTDNVTLEHALSRKAKLLERKADLESELQEIDQELDELAQLIKELAQ